MERRGAAFLSAPLPLADRESPGRSQLRASIAALGFRVPPEALLGSHPLTGCWPQAPLAAASLPSLCLITGRCLRSDNAFVFHVAA